jgi:hypothetical protein
LPQIHYHLSGLFLARPLLLSPGEQEKSVCTQDWALPVNLNRFNVSPERPSFLTREQFIPTSFSALRSVRAHYAGSSL